MLSLELHENTSEIRNGAFKNCYCLRNVAFPPNAVFGDDDIFIVTLMGTTIISHLYQLFGSESRIIFDDDIFIDEDHDEMTDLQRLFGSIAEIIRQLQHRFDRLPILF